MRPIAVVGGHATDPTPLLLALARSRAPRVVTLVGCSPSRAVAHAVRQEVADAAPEGAVVLPASGVCDPALFERIGADPDFVPAVVRAGARAAFEFDGVGVPRGAAAESGSGEAPAVLVFEEGGLPPSLVPLTTPPPPDGRRWFALGFAPGTGVPSAPFAERTGEIIAYGRDGRGREGVSVLPAPPGLLVAGNASVSVLPVPEAFGPADEFAVTRAARAAWLALRAGLTKPAGEALDRAWAAERAALLRNGAVLGPADAAYAMARGAGAWGGRPSAAGLALLAPAEAVPAVRAAVA